MPLTFPYQSKRPLALWYNQPATTWSTEALPFGNAFMGGMVFGGIHEEQIQFTEETIWTGGPGSNPEYNGGNRKDAWKHLSTVRKLLDEGEFDKAHELAEQELSGVISPREGNEFGDYGAQQPFGDIYVAVANEGEISGYERHLDLTCAVARTGYKAGDVQHVRETFASYPKRSFISRFENDAADGCTYKIRLISAHADSRNEWENNTLIVSGAVKDNGMEYEARLQIVAKDGALSFEDGVITVSDSHCVELRMTSATDYLNEYPHYKGRDFVGLNQRTINAIADVDYDTLRKEAVADYQSLFNRMTLELDNGNTAAASLPTNERLQAYQDGRSDRGLEALYFQYGRYLLIASSRPGSMPANLQGKWNNRYQPDWAGDYHMNINQQMIYWPAEPANLAETHQPLVDYIETLVTPGQVTAKSFFNARGWVVSTMNNPFGFTAPGWKFPWGYFQAAAAWLCRHLWDHYAYNGDVEFLEKQAFPIMKEAALFWLDYLIEDEQGALISSPSYSPEHGGISKSAYMDLEIVWDHFTNVMKVCDVLEIRDDFYHKVAEFRERLAPLSVGRWGQLQEWREDRDDPESDHRHLSHLYALYPSAQISTVRTPELAQAAQTTLDKRGDSGTGWSMAWKANFWVRLKNGDRALQQIGNMLNPTDKTETTYVSDGGTYSNLLCAHPPFQLDGSMGVIACMTEMLVQSHDDCVELLAALPEGWATGKVTGIRARGGLELDIEWQNNQLVQVSMTAHLDGEFNIVYGGQSKVVEMKKGQTGVVVSSEDFTK